jgi:hypothetical protein
MRFDVCRQVVDVMSLVDIVEVLRESIDEDAGICRLYIDIGIAVVLVVIRKVDSSGFIGMCWQRSG